MAGGYSVTTEKKDSFSQPFIKPTTTPTAAVTRTVGGNETVQGQISGLMSAGNPLLERAKTKAAQAANQRGLLNSSMGVQAGQEAMLSAALPIAQADAQTYARQAQLNQEAQNRFGEQANAFGFQSALSGQEYGQKQGLAATEQGYRTALQSQSEAHQKGLQSQAEVAKASESALERGHQTGLQSSEQTFRAGESALGRGHQGLLQTQAETARQRLQTQAEAARIYQQTQAEKHQQALQAQSEGARSSLSAQESTQRIAQVGVESEERRKTIAAELIQRLTNAKELEGLSQSNKVALTELDKEMKLAIQGSASASQILTQTMDAIGEVSANKDLDTQSVNDRISSIVSNANSNLKLIENWTNMGEF